jgi:hypothetical protein
MMNHAQSLIGIYRVLLTVFCHNCVVVGGLGPEEDR